MIHEFTYFEVPYKWTILRSIGTPCIVKGFVIWCCFLLIHYLCFTYTSGDSIIDTPNKGVVDDSQPKGSWEDNEVNAMQTSDEIQKPSFANMVNRTSEVRSNPKVNFRAMVNHEKIDNSDFMLLITTIHAMKHKFENSLVGFLVGKKVAFLLVKNYVTNTWAKFGFEKVMSDDDGVFYFKFASLKGLKQVLEQSLWLIMIKR
uniref:DUF4283 domain-containing protein n=1 Tax=Tanacetum cinerariifolium TaxID=118510 RepID=A0A6L2JSN5_TANCI|nr:hypothetical protein [Tanacetum cinerariifolium]